MKNKISQQDPFQPWIFELGEMLREVKTSQDMLDSWTQVDSVKLSFLFFSSNNVLRNSSTP